MLVLRIQNSFKTDCMICLINIFFCVVIIFFLVNNLFTSFYFQSLPSKFKLLHTVRSSKFATQTNDLKASLPLVEKFTSSHKISRDRYRRKNFWFLRGACWSHIFLCGRHVWWTVSITSGYRKLYSNFTLAVFWQNIFFLRRFQLSNSSTIISQMALFNSLIKWFMLYIPDTTFFVYQLISDK